MVSTPPYTRIPQDLNGLRMVVRFEVDACIPPEEITSSGPGATTNVDDLIGALANVDLTPKSESTSTPNISKANTVPKLTVLAAGSEVPQSAIVELTTRSVNRAMDYDWKESYPQLYLSQTPHHFLAVHERGRFVRVDKRKLGSSELREVMKDVIQPDLKKLRRLLDLIKELVFEHGQRGRLSLVCQGGELKVFERTEQKSCLPDEFMDKFSA
jgi:hypothetical protein